MTKEELIQARQDLIEVDTEVLSTLIKTTRVLLETNPNPEQFLAEMAIHEFGAVAATAHRWAGALCKLARAPRAAY